MTKTNPWICKLLVIVLLVSSCTSAASTEEVADLAPGPSDDQPVADVVPATPGDAPNSSGPTPTDSNEPAVDSDDSVDPTPAPSAEGLSGEEVLLVRQSDGETSRMFTIRADGTGEQEFRLPAPCDTADSRCAVLRVMPSINGRALIVGVNNLFWYDVPTGDITHIAQIDNIQVSLRKEWRYLVATASTDAGPLLVVVDRETGTTFDTPVDGMTQLVTELPNGVLAHDQAAPSVIVNMTSASTATIDEKVLFGIGEVSTDGRLIAAYDRRSGEFQLVVIDVDNPLGPSSWPQRKLDFAFDWVGQQMLTIADQDGVVQLVDEFDSAELDRLWPGESQRARSVVVDPTGAYALVHLSTRDDELWFRVDIAGGQANEVAELRGMESSDISVHTDQRFVWVTDTVDDDRKYTRLVAVPIAPGKIVEVSTTQAPSNAVVSPLGDEHIFVRSFGNRDASVPETWWIVSLNTGERTAAAPGNDPHLSADGSTVALSTGPWDRWVVLVPLQDPAAAVPLVAGAAIGWIER